MTSLQTFWLIGGLILGGLCIFGLGFCAGSIHELSKDLLQLKDERFQLDRDIKSLEKMQTEHDEKMAELEEYELRYEDAYNTAMKIINEQKEKAGA